MDDNLREIRERINDKKSELGLSYEDLSRRTGLSKSTIQRYVTGDIGNLGLDKLEILAKALNCSPSYLMGWDKNTNNAVKIPVYHAVSAGSPILTNDEIIDWAEIPKEKAVGNDHFGLIVKGMSMYPTFQEGDLLIVRKQNDVNSGDLAIVLVNGDEATFKEVRKRKDGIMLVGYNPTVFTPKFFSAEDIENLPVRIIGKVVEFRREL